MKYRNKYKLRLLNYDEIQDACFKMLICFFILLMRRHASAIVNVWFKGKTDPGIEMRLSKN